MPITDDQNFDHNNLETTYQPLTVEVKKPSDDNFFATARFNDLPLDVKIAQAENPFPEEDMQTKTGTGEHEPIIIDSLPEGTFIPPVDNGNPHNFHTSFPGVDVNKSYTLGPTPQFDKKDPKSELKWINKILREDDFKLIKSRKTKKVKKTKRENKRAEVRK